MEEIVLPYQVIQLLATLNAPQRLQRHLHIVHAVALKIILGLKREFPSLEIQEELVLFGAATHDIGKVQIPSELVASGKKHELLGQKLLIEHGFSTEMSRFAFTHGNWTKKDVTLEDVLVSLSDKIWKGKRVDDLEEQVIQIISTQIQVNFWDVYTILDTILSQIAIGADKRLSWQNEI